MERLAQEAFAGVPERRVADVVAERDRLDEVAVETEQLSDRPRHAADELDVQPAAADVVVLDEAEHLRLAGVAVVGGDVEDLLDVAREGGAGERRLVVGVRLAADHVLVGGAEARGAACRAVGAYGGLDFGIEREVGDGAAHGGVLSSDALGGASHRSRPL